MKRVPEAFEGRPPVKPRFSVQPLGSAVIRYSQTKKLYSPETYSLMIDILGLIDYHVRDKWIFKKSKVV